MTHAWFASDDETVANTWNGPSWSVSSEWFAYVFVFPVLIALFGRTQRVGMLVTVAVLTMLASSILHDLLTDRVLIKRATNLGILRIIPEFFLGWALGRFAMAGAVRPDQWRLLVYPSIAALIALTHALPPEAGGWHVLTILLFAPLIYGLFLMGLASEEGPMSSRVLVYGGEISYAIYMTHAFVAAVWFNGIKIVAPRLLRDYSEMMVAASIALVLLAACLAHHLVEKPARGYLRHTWRRTLAS